MRWLLPLALLLGCQRSGPGDIAPAHNPRAVEEPKHEARAHVVMIRGMQFDPAHLDVARGDSVTWTNDDIVPHTATAGDGKFDSAMIAAGASYKWTADVPGDHAYACTVHPLMKGTIKVQ